MTDAAASSALSMVLTPELVSELLVLARGHGAEFAEVYGEYSVLSSFSLEEDRLKSAGVSIVQGVGVRAIRGDQTGYAYADGFAPDDVREAARVAATIAREGAVQSRGQAFAVVEAAAPFRLDRPAPTVLDEAARIALLGRANHAARAYDPRIHEVSAGFTDSSRSFIVANSDGRWAEDRQYLSRLTVTALALDGDNRQSGYESAGGSVNADYFEREQTPEQVATEAARCAVTLLGAREPEAGAYPVVVGPGWGGVIVHECFGHSMEGDTIRKQTSIRATQKGRQVAAPGVTIVDSGLVPYSRGSFRVDDEGTPSQRTVLVQDGVLVGYLWDLLNGRLMGEPSTGNGRRSSYRDFPLCRMTNTYIEAGPHSPDELVAAVSRGLYCKTARRRLGQSRRRQLLVPGHRGLSDREREAHLSGAQRDAHRQRQRRDAEDRRGGQRSRDQRHHRLVRQGRSVETGRRGSADGAFHRDHRGRDRTVSGTIGTQLDPIASLEVTRPRRWSARAPPAPTRPTRSSTARARSRSACSAAGSRH
jgi:TldD protein